MAVVNANYEFVMVDIGVNGRISDRGVINSTKFANMPNNNLLNLSQHVCLPTTNRKLPYIFVADDAFSMYENLLKPYVRFDLRNDQRIFNY